MGESAKNICIVVLGDIGRSPRMQYHSLSLAEHGHKIDIIGYGETKPPENLKLQSLLNYHYLIPYPTFACPKLLNYVLKTVWQAISLLFLFLILRTPDVILVQNPPAIPALLVCWIYSLIIRARLIVDWHNYGHSIMALNVGSQNLLVKITKKIEAFVGRQAHNFCVTNGMKNDLENNWHISAITLYDRPPKIFHPISLEEKHAFLTTFELQVKEKLDISELDERGSVCLKANRPGLLVSSTSWTEDEDFSILFESLQEYENHCIYGNSKRLPNLVCIVTGKGPLKDYYCSKIAESLWKHVKIITPWLESEDYPKVLASADLGVSLHTSSSGLDLPMKVIDMFGSGLPVCAYNFKCLNELVKHEVNSYTFNNSQELTQQLQQWFENFPNNENTKKIQEKFKSELEAFQLLRWNENWDKIALPLFQ